MLLEGLRQSATWSSLALVLYGFLAAAAPILLYIEFNRDAYTLYESSFLRDFWHGVQTAPFPSGIQPYTKQLWDCFFTIPGPRFFIPDVLPIPLPYYWLLVPGIVLALWQKRFEIVLLANDSRGRRFCRTRHREPPAFAHPILDDSDELHGCMAVKAAVARRADCCRRCGSANTARRLDSVRSIHLRQDEESVFDSPLCAGRGRCFAVLKTCRCRTRTPRSSSS